MAEVRSIDVLDAKGLRVLVRVDFNVPLQQGVVGDDTRIKAVLPTIKHLLAQGARVIVMSHLGRPAGSGFEEALSLYPVAKRLSELLKAPVAFASDTVGLDAHAKVDALGTGEVLLLENLRFDAREKQNDPEFCEELASLGQVYVNDAFGSAHRAHASTAGVAALLPSYAGYLLQQEVHTLSRMLEAPRHPFVAILGGSKVSDKIGVIDALIDICDTLIIGGGMCFTFLLAQGYSVGKSLQEPEWVTRAHDMLDKAERQGVKILLPTDVICGDRVAKEGVVQSVSCESIPSDMMGLDIGPQSAARCAEVIAGAATLFWNGPLGVFEVPAFAQGTRVVAQAVADNVSAQSIIGGGDSVAAINLFGLADKMTFISTGGGASMELIEGKALPGVEALKETKGSKHA